MRRYTIFTPHKILWAWSNQGAWISEQYSTHERNEKFTQNSRRKREKKGPFREAGCRCKDNIKISLKETEYNGVIELLGPGWCPVAGAWDNSNEIPGFIKGGKLTTWFAINFSRRTLLYKVELGMKIRSYMDLVSFHKACRRHILLELK